MNRFFSKTCHRLIPYVPGEQPEIGQFIKLNTNENPYPPAPGVAEVLSTVAPALLRLYPDPTAKDLRTAIAAHYGVQQNEVFVGNGSDEVLAFVFQAFFGSEDAIAFPDITYSFYPVYANLYNIPYTTVPLTNAWAVDLSVYPKPLKGIVLANPNAPTGLTLSPEVIEEALKKRPDTLFVVDEAYVDFGGASVIPLVHSYSNLLVVKTMSKSRAFAGMRVGYAVGQSDLLEGIIRVKDSFNSYPLDIIAQKAATASFQDTPYFEQRRQQVIETRERFVQSLNEIGLSVLPSKANFVFVSKPGFDGTAILSYLRENGVLVRHFQKPRLAPWVRVTIGTDSQMSEVVDLLKKWV